jgi:hypothetical protein
MDNLLSRMGEKDHKIGKFNIKKLGMSLKAYILSHKATDNQKKEYLDRMSIKRKEEDITVSVEMEDIERFLKLGEDEMDFANPITDWAEEVAEHEERILKASKGVEGMFLEEVHLDKLEGNEDFGIDSDIQDFQWSNETKMVEELAELFFSVDLDDVGQSYKDFNFIKMMPLENQFWLDIVSMVEAEPKGPSILNKLNNGMTLTDNDYLMSQSAFFISICVGKNLFSSKQSKLTSQAESSMGTSTRDPIVSEEDIESHIRDLTKKIREIDESLSVVTGFAKEFLEKKKTELDVQLKAYQDNTVDHIIPDLNYYVFMDTLLRKLKEDGIYDKTDQSSELEVLSTLLISDVIESSLVMNRNKMLSDNDMNNIRVRIWDRVVNTSFIRHISNAMNTGIELVIKGKDVYEHYPKYSSRTIEISINNVDPK